jgi:uncharacterized protein YjbI with pentapeptide repeats
MTATVGATPRHDALTPARQSVPTHEGAFTQFDRLGGRGTRGSFNGKSPASRPPRANGTATLSRQIAIRQQRLRLTRPARPTLQSRWHQTLAAGKENLVNLFVRVDWTKVTALIAAIAAVAGIYFSYASLKQAWKQNKDAARGQLSDQLNKAIGYLDPNKNGTDVVVGGIYSLEKLTEDPSADENLRNVVFDVLGTYVGAHSPAGCAKLAAPSPDVRAALKVIGRRKFAQQIDLSNACLTGADLREARLDHAWLNSATLTGATLAGADLTSADLSYAVLNNASLQKDRKTGKETNLVKAALVDARLDHANLSGANLSGAVLTGADLTGADLTGANLTRICYESPPRWPDGFNPPPSSGLKCDTL